MRIWVIVVGVVVLFLGPTALASAKGPCARAFESRAEYRAPTADEVQDYEQRPLSELLQYGELEISSGSNDGCFSRITTTSPLRIASVEIPVGSPILIGTRFEVHTMDPESPVTWNGAPIRVARFESAGQSGVLTTYLRLTAVQLAQPSTVGNQTWEGWVHFDRRGLIERGVLAKNWQEYSGRIWIGPIRFNAGDVVSGQLARPTAIKGTRAPAGTFVTFIRDNGWVGAILTRPDESYWAWLGRGLETIEANWDANDGEVQHSVGDDVTRYRGSIDIYASEAVSLAVRINGRSEPVFRLRTDIVERP